MKILVAIVITAVIAGAGGYFIGNNASSSAHKSEISKIKKEKSEVENELWGNSTKTVQLQTDYNDLVDRYTKLYAAASAYVQATQYTPSKVIRCNSYSYGMNSTSTTCY